MTGSVRTGHFSGQSPTETAVADDVGQPPTERDGTISNAGQRSSGKSRRLLESQKAVVTASQDLHVPLWQSGREGSCRLER